MIYSPASLLSLVKISISSGSRKLMNEGKVYSAFCPVTSSTEYSISYPQKGIIVNGMIVRSTAGLPIMYSISWICSVDSNVVITQSLTATVNYSMYIKF